jgi:hypothetical protein
MAYFDFGTSLMVISAIFGGVLGFAAVAFNIFGLLDHRSAGVPGRQRFILHAIGIPMYPRGAVLGLIWFFKWRKS